MDYLSGNAGKLTDSLLRGGVVIEPGEELSVAEYVRFPRPSGRALTVDRIGWHRDSFILPDRVFHPEFAPFGQEEVVYAGPAEPHCFEVRGTVEDWKEHVGRLCSGNSRLTLSVSCALTAPTLPLLQEESGGFHLHSRTSVGKTTTGIVGGSTSGGGGENGFVETWRATANGIEGSAFAHNNTALFLDEISQLSPDDINDTAYMLANGEGKKRMNADGSLRRRATWRLLFFSNGECTIEEHAASAASNRKIRGGVEVRVLGIPADAGRGMGVFENLHGMATPGEFAERLKSAALNVYGSPLRLWLDYLVNYQESCRELLQGYVDEFVRTNMPNGDHPEEVRRAVRRFAIPAAAGELATDLDITGWRSGEAMKGIGRCFRDWLNSRAGKGSFDSERMVGQVRYFLQTNQSRFQNLSGTVEVDDPTVVNYPSRNMAGYTRGGTYLILTEVFRQDVCRGYRHQ